ncbi:MAG TPA: hypothetical protein PLE33_08395 [Candidatus Cloacimonas sp.]|nr:hypothetical protein [Candidatus Cloacimonas sp.]HPS61261.1 hypothetical protein [Candidatus Cloacimonas sp.]
MLRNQDLILRLSKLRLTALPIFLLMVMPTAVSPSVYNTGT